MCMLIHVYSTISRACISCVMYIFWDSCFPLKKERQSREEKNSLHSAFHGKQAAGRDKETCMLLFVRLSVRPSVCSYLKRYFHLNFCLHRNCDKSFVLYM